MGTNYYWRITPCGTCGRGDTLHVGKSGPSFRGHFDWVEGEPRPNIVSWADWRSVLRSGGGELWDEYDVQVDVEEFIAHIESRDTRARRRQYDWCADPANWWTGTEPQYLDQVVPRGRWLDADGFSFYGGDFS